MTTATNKIDQVNALISEWREEKKPSYCMVAGNYYKGTHESFLIDSHYANDSKYDGMIINYEDGIYEVSEYQAGKNQTDIKVFLETKSLKLALNCFDRGNKQRYKHIIDMS